VIIDCHVHAGEGDGFTGPWDTAAPLGDYLRRARAAGITRAVLFAAFHTDYQRANRAVARLVRARPDRFWGFAFVHAGRDRGRIRRMVEEAVNRWSFVGIKVHRHDARLTREVCDTARALHLPILYDVAGEVSSVELFAGAYPDVPFIIPHLGSFADDWAAQTAFLPTLEGMANVHTDTSGVRRFDLLARAVERAGAHKVLFGTDGPWLHPGVELAKVRALSLSSGEEARILGGNFMRLTAPVRSLIRAATGAAHLQRPVCHPEPLRGPL
jgi:predicted TIM-barrel fold metal-dependent hydrolase